MILSEAPLRVIKDACKSYEEALKRILAALEGVASSVPAVPKAFGKRHNPGEWMGMVDS
jgi:hypothetical protein